MDSFDLSRPTEAQVERYLKKKVEQAGGLCLKFVSPNFSGVPDRMILLPGGRIIFAELKAPGKKARKLQLRVHRMFREFGFEVFSEVDSYAKCDEIAKRLHK